MLETAVIHLDLSPDEFWELSWHEWELYVKRLEEKRNLRKLQVEENRMLTSVLWATIMNTHSHRTAGSKSYSPSELFAKEEQPKETVDFDFDTVVNRFGRKIKKKDAD